MRSYEDAAAGYTPLQQALLDNQRATDEAVKKAQELGATEAQLAPIRAQGQQQSRGSGGRRTEKRSTTSTLPSPTNWPRWTAPRKRRPLRPGILVRRTAPPGRGTGADVTQIDALYARKRIDLAEQAQQEALQAYREGVAEAIRFARRTDRRHHPGPAVRRAGHAGYSPPANGLERSSVPGRRSRGFAPAVAGRDRPDETGRANPTTARRHRRALPGRSRSHQRHQFGQPDEERAGNSQRRTHPRHRREHPQVPGQPSTCRSSPAHAPQRLAEAARQYQELLARAQAGDATAGDQITQAADAYLQEARSYYASSGAYTAIFDQVRAALEGLTGVSFADPVQAEAEYRSTTVDLQTQSVDLQSQIADAQAAALSELAALDDVLKDLQADADDQLTATIAALEETLREETDKNIAAIAAQSDKNAAAVTVALDRLSQANETALQNNATAVAASMGTIMTTLLDQLIERINVNSAQQANTRQVA